MVESVGKCYQCKFWEMEPGAFNQGERALIGVQEIVGRTEADEEVSTDMRGMYGKCTAIHPQLGMMGSFECKVKDGDGNYMFESVEEG